MRLTLPRSGQADPLQLGASHLGDGEADARTYLYGALTMCSGGKRELCKHAVIWLATYVAVGLLFACYVWGD